MAIDSTQCLNSDRQVWWQESYLVDIGYHIIIIPSHQLLGKFNKDAREILPFGFWITEKK